MSVERQQLGRDGEAAVAAWYRSHGWEVLAANWRCRDGEIDLVVGRGTTLVICEVKTRRSDRFGTGAEAVGVTKQRKVRTVARAFLAAHDVRAAVVRFDVAVVVPGPRGFAVEVIEGAF